MQSDYFKIWNDFIIERNRLSSPIKFTNNTEKFIWILFARINSLSDEIIFLVKNSRFFSCQILMRSALETYIDLKCLVNDDSFIEVLFQAERKSGMAYLKNHSLSNAYYGIQTKEDIEKELIPLQKLSGKTKNLSVYDKFEKAKELEAYKTVYNHLCRFSHGNITALASKNFEDDQVKFNTSISDKELIFVLSSSINFAIASSIEVVSKLELGDTFLNSFSNLLKKNNNIAKKSHKREKGVKS